MRFLSLLSLLVLAACNTPRDADVAAALDGAEATPEAAVPDWAKDAVWYQIFPERFRNGDPTNDPTRETLETPVVPGADWRISPWTADWYARDDWERAMGPDFYENGVFHRRYGGDLQGVIDKLDYLRDLGVTALYFNPVFYARSMHKYDGNTYHHIDPYFGPDPEGDFALMAQETSSPATWHVTAADSLFFALVRQAHQRGLRVVIDGVFNHTGRDFFAFDDIRRNGPNSAYKDWYIVRSFDDPATPQNEFRYKGWWGVESLPEFANNADSTDLHPGPKQYVMDATARWMDPNGDGNPSDGIDGWRLDVTEEVPVGFWRDWNAHVRSLNPEAYTVTEIWGDAAHYIAEGGFSATMNYYGFAFPVKGFLVDGTFPAEAFADTLDARRARYAEPVQYAMQNLMDSHDTDRLASMIVNASRPGGYRAPDRFDYDWGERVSPRYDRTYLTRAPNEQEREIQRMVALFQMTYVGAPMLYYGTEVGMWGGDDPDDRKPMLWADLHYDAERRNPRGGAARNDAVQVDSTLLDFYKDAIALRNRGEVFRRGSYETLLADGEHQLFAFRRTLGSASAVVVFNRSDEAHSVRIPIPGGPGTAPYDVQFATTDGPHRVQQDAGALLVEIPARTALVLQP